MRCPKDLLEPVELLLIIALFRFEKVKDSFVRLLALDDLERSVDSFCGHDVLIPYVKRCLYEVALRAEMGAERINDFFASL